MSSEKKIKSIKLILASASARRKKYFEYLEIPFAIKTTQHIEKELKGFFKKEIFKQLVKDKTIGLIDPKMTVDSEYIISADTVVINSTGQILEKTSDRSLAKNQLETLFLAPFNVYTGIYYLLHHHSGDLTEDFTLTKTQVCLDPNKQDLLDWYLDIEHWQDKAGSFSYQGLGQLFISAINGSVSNIIGFPLEVFLDKANVMLGHNWKDHVQ
jgi:septum formation protein